MEDTVFANEVLLPLPDNEDIKLSLRRCSSGFPAISSSFISDARPVLDLARKLRADELDARIFPAPPMP